MALKTYRLNCHGMSAVALTAFCCLVILLLMAHGRLVQAADQSADVKMANHYLEAAKNGDVKAEFYMGALYSTGVGVPPSDAEGFRWFLRAAEHGNSEARIIVGASYATGRGVTRNYIDAYKWTFVAAATGDLPETRNGGRQLLDVLSARMSDKDIADARRQAQSVLNQTAQPPAAPPPAQPAQSQGQTDSHIAAKENPPTTDYDRLTNDIARDPNNVDSYVKRGSILTQQGKYALADRDLSKAIELDPNNTEARNNRCWTRIMLDLADVAVADCTKALDARPDYVDALDSRGLANLKLGHFDQAVNDFGAALRLKPKLASSLYGRGIAHNHLGDKAEGGADIASALAIDPKIKDRFDQYGVH
jgi:tetratricopeptide (TPR) repeat protein